MIRSTSPVLVTGAAGFVGSHLIELLAREHTALLAWRRPEPTPLPASNGVRWTDVELLDRPAVRQALEAAPPSAIYHLAGAPHVAQSWQHTRETYEVNVLATHNLFAALHELGLAPRVVVTGSATIYRSQARPIREDDEISPASPYATSKLAQEMLARRVWEEDRIPAILARAFNHIGPRQDPSFVTASIAKQIARIEAGQVPPVLKVGNLEPRRDLTDVRDTVRAYSALMRHGRPGVPYNVSSGRGLAIGDLVQTFVARARRAVEIRQDPALLRPNDVPLLVGDHSRLTADTGWEPAISFDQTVDDLLEYWRARVQREA